MENEILVLIGVAVVAVVFYVNSKRDKKSGTTPYIGTAKPTPVRPKAKGGPRRKAPAPKKAAPKKTTAKKAAPKKAAPKRSGPKRGSAKAKPNLQVK
jgi:hypothetical protein|tara:strand:+ start:6277 stop:6567 length:291 start_codon:yes stop_codon:yes gene_type:complete